MWKDVVGNRLLARATILLLMTKTDLLQHKIAAGVDVRKYLPKFQGNATDPVEVTKCELRLNSESCPFC